jgi:hypothetical protein
METSIVIVIAAGLLALIIAANVWYWGRRAHLSKRQKEREDREEEAEEAIW